MDALKKLARWVLREELGRRDQVLKASQEMYSVATAGRDGARRETRRAADSRDELLDRVSKMREWGAENGDTTALAWSDHITQLHSGPGSFGIVHPFDRWGVSPKPKQEPAMCQPHVKFRPTYRPFRAEQRSVPSPSPAQTPREDTSSSLASAVLFGSMFQSSDPSPSPAPAETFSSSGGGDFGGGGASGSWGD